jgi:PAS domain S-box-containing protein
LLLLALGADIPAWGLAALAALALGGTFLRTHADEGARAARERLEHLVDAIPLATIAFKRNGDIATWNRAAQDLFGWSADEVFGDRNPTVMEESLEESEEFYQRIMSGEVLRGVEVVRQRKDGHKISLALYTAPLPDGNESGFLVLYDDITERKRIEHERDAAQRLYRDLIEALPLVTYIDAVDEGPTGIYTSPQIERLLGWTVIEWMTKPFSELLHPDDRDRVMAMVSRSNATRELFEAEYRLRHKDGHFVWVRDHSSIVEDAEGTPVARGFLLDITAQKRLEEQLLQAQKMDALGQFAGGIAHDFNNLLTAIGGYADLASASLPADSEAHRSLTGIRTAATEAAGLTSRLLSFSRRHVPGRHPVDLNEVVRGAAELLDRLVREDVVIELELADDLPAVSADDVQLKQVVVNLALNARDAMPAGGSLRIETGILGDHVALRVTDDGHGMDDLTRAQAINPFFTTKPPGEGTGLGLSVAYAVARSLDGELRLTSEQGVGTTVELLLPATDGHPETTERVHDPAGGSERILVVEDRSLVRNLARSVLTGAGFDVVTAAGGDEALELVYAGTELDLLLTDVVMPGMSGAELARQLRTLQPELPVLYMSGYTDDVLHPAELAEPRTSFLAKPFHNAELVAAARSALDG